MNSLRSIYDLRNNIVSGQGILIIIVVVTMILRDDHVLVVALSTSYMPFHGILTISHPAKELFSYLQMRKVKLSEIMCIDQNHIDLFLILQINTKMANL